MELKRGCRDASASVRGELRFAVPHPKTWHSVLCGVAARRRADREKEGGEGAAARPRAGWGRAARSGGRRAAAPGRVTGFSAGRIAHQGLDRRNEAFLDVARGI